MVPGMFRPKLAIPHILDWGRCLSDFLQLRVPQVIGNGSFGVVFQATLVETGENVAVKKVLQDKRFKVCCRGNPAKTGKPLRRAIHYSSIHYSSNYGPNHPRLRAL